MDEMIIRVLLKCGANLEARLPAERAQAFRKTFHDGCAAGASDEIETEDGVIAFRWSEVAGIVLIKVAALKRAAMQQELAQAGRVLQPMGRG